MSYLNKLTSYFSWLRVPLSQARRPISQPGRDWNIILYSAGGIFMALLIAAGFIYWQQTTMVVSDAPVASAAIFSPEDLEKALAAYETRATEHEALLQGETPFADPAQPK